MTTVSTVENWVPKPRDKSIMKKRIDQRGEIGILETASGYAMKASPAPGWRKLSLSLELEKFSS